jgi:hypothetical protein
VLLATNDALPWGTRSKLAAASWARYPSLAVFAAVFMAQNIFSSGLTVVIFGELMWIRAFSAVAVVATFGLPWIVARALGLIGDAPFSAVFHTFTAQEQADDGLGDGWVAWLLRPQGEWIDKRQVRNSKAANTNDERSEAAKLVARLKDNRSNFVRRHFVLFGDYNDRHQYFLLVELGFSFALAVLAVCVDVAGCIRVAWCAVVLLAIYVTVLVMRRPHESTLNLGFTLLLALAQWASVLTAALRTVVRKR